MRNLKYVMGTTVASASLWLAPVAPVAADSNTENSNNNNGNVTTTVNTDNSQTWHIGDCVVMMDDIKVWLDQYNKQKSSQTNVDTDLDGGGLPYINEFDGPRGGGDDGNTTNQSNSNSQSQANSQSVVITVAPDCSVTNVQQAAAVKGAQTDAPKGGVGAGVGAGASLFASVAAAASAVGAGFGLRRFGN